MTRDGITHKRNLQQDLLRLKEHFGVTCIVCLLNAAELRVGEDQLSLTCMQTTQADTRSLATGTTHTPVRLSEIESWKQKLCPNC